MSGGAVQGQFDEFGAIGFRACEGFREHSRENTEILFADLGYNFNDQVENPFYLTLDGTNRNLPGGVTKSEMQNDPAQANPLAIAENVAEPFTSLIRIGMILQPHTGPATPIPLFPIAAAWPATAVPWP